MRTDFDVAAQIRAPIGRKRNLLAVRFDLEQFFLYGHETDIRILHIA